MNSAGTRTARCAHWHVAPSIGQRPPTTAKWGLDVTPSSRATAAGGLVAKEPTIAEVDWHTLPRHDHRDDGVAREPLIR